MAFSGTIFNFIVSCISGSVAPSNLTLNLNNSVAGSQRWEARLTSTTAGQVVTLGVTGSAAVPSSGSYGVASTGPLGVTGTDTMTIQIRKNTSSGITDDVVTTELRINSSLIAGSFTTGSGVNMSAYKDITSAFSTTNISPGDVVEIDIVEG